MNPVLHTMHCQFLGFLQSVRSGSISALKGAAAHPGPFLLFAIPNVILIALLLFVALPHARTPPPLIVLPFGEEIQAISIVGGGFYKYNPRKKVPLIRSHAGHGEGVFRLTRKGTSIAPARETALDGFQFALYRALAGDEICLRDTCITLTSDNLLATRRNGNAVDWTTSHIRLEPSMVLVNRLLVVEMPAGTTALVFDTRSESIEAVTASPAGRAEIHLAEASRWSAVKIAYFFLFTVMALGSLNLMLGSLSKHGMPRLAKSSVAIIMVMALYYFLFFPGLFFADHVFTLVNSGRFTVWFSAAYMVYSYIAAAPGLLLFQLPMVALVSFMLVDINEHVRELQPALLSRLTSTYLILNAALSPFLFVLAFCVQRYWTAAAFMIAGATFLFTGLARVSTQPPPPTLRRIWVGLVCMAIGASMRAEYTLLLGTAVVGTFIRLVYLQVRVPQLHVKVAVIALVLWAAVIGYAVPRIHMPQDVLKDERSTYSLSYLLDMVKPYTRCPGGMNAKIRQGIELSGGLQAYCAAERPGNFYWARARWIGADRANLAGALLQRGLLEELATNPAPSMTRFFFILVEIIDQPAPWQVANQYLIQTTSDDGHTAGADLMGLVLHRPNVRLAHEIVAYLFKFYSKPINVLLLIAIVLVLLVYPILFRWNGLVLALNLAVITTAVGAIFFAPGTDQSWAYIIILPLWATFAPVYHMLAPSRSIRS